MFFATKKLNKYKKILEVQSRVNFGNVKKNIKYVKDCLWKVEVASVSTGDHEEMVWLKKDLNDLLDKEEKMWQQRSCIQWLKSGNQNMRFFHGIETRKEEEEFHQGTT